MGTAPLMLQGCLLLGLSFPTRGPARACPDPTGTWGSPSPSPTSCFSLPPPPPKIFVFTTAKLDYTERILEVLDPQKKLIR